MPWNAIAYVGSGLTLTAFIVATAAWVYRTRILERERTIRSAPEAERSLLIQQTLEFFDVDTSGLTREHKYGLALQQIHERAKRFRLTALVVIVIACLAASISAFAIWRLPTASATAPSTTTATSPAAVLPGSAPARPKKVVVMDNPVLVYDEQTRDSNGNNIDDITKILQDRSTTTLDVEVEPISTNTGNWDFNALVVRKNPDLIIVHASCFYKVTNIRDPEGKFRDFLRHVGTYLPNTKLLIYSRAFERITREDIARYERESNLSGRVKTFPVPGGTQASFRRRDTRDRLIEEVAVMLRS
jgi:hypothetical protein